ncbi:unnamed protein product, partial [Symbiodinium microadriaticum]
EAKEAEKAVRPLIAVPGEGWDLEKILATLRDVEGAEGFEVWGKRLMLRVQTAHEPATRLKITGKEHAPTDLLWRMSGVPHIKLAQLTEFLQIRLLWDIEEVISFRKKDAVIRAAMAPPAEFQCGGQDIWSIIMGSEVVTIRQIIPRHRRQEKGPAVDVTFAKASRPTPKDWSKLLTPVPHAPPMEIDFDEEDPDLDEPQDDSAAVPLGTHSAALTSAPGALDQFLRSQAAPGSAKHNTLTKVTTELTETAQQQLRQVIEKNAEDTAAQQRWIELAVDNKLANFQKALVDQQAAWEKTQDRKLHDLQATQKEFQDLTQQEFQNVHDTAATRHQDLMNQMTSMMAVLQAHGPDRAAISNETLDALDEAYNPTEAWASMFFQGLNLVVFARPLVAFEILGFSRLLGGGWLDMLASLVSFLGIRLGEAEVPGHRRRAAKGYNLARKVNNLKLRSHNMGGLRSWDKKSQLWSEDAADVLAIQETWADAKDILDGQRHLAVHGLRSYWSSPGPARGHGSGTMVAALRPVVSKECFTDGFDSEMDHLWASTRVAGAWVETNQVDNGFAVLSFYGLAGSNACSSERLESERLLLALLCHLGAYKHRPIFLCMDSNLSFEKSDTMQALIKLGWTDLAAGLGGTFKIKPMDADPCSRIDFVFANPAAAGLVMDVQLRWLPGFQHAALDIDLHLGLCDLDTYDEWASDTWQGTFSPGFNAALDQKDTAGAWQICEAFDSECLQMTLDLAGITDPKATSGRGVMPSVVQCSPSRHRAPGFDHAWNSFVAWLESLFALHAVDSFASGLQLETRWRLGCAGYHGFLSNLLALECSLPEGVTWWQELRLRLDLAIKDRAAAAVQRNTSAKAAWAKKMRSIVHACKHLKGTQHKQTSCLIRPGARSSLTVMRNNHIIRALPNVPKSAFSQLWWDRASEVRIQDVPQALRVWTCSYCHKGIRDDPSLPEHVVQAAGRKHLYRCTAHKISLRDNLTRCSKLGLTRQVAGGTTSAGARVQQMKVDALPQGPTRHVATHVIFVLSHGAVAVTSKTRCYPEERAKHLRANVTVWKKYRVGFAHLLSELVRAWGLTSAEASKLDQWATRLTSVNTGTFSNDSLRLGSAPPSAIPAAGCGSADSGHVAMPIMLLDGDVCTDHPAKMTCCSEAQETLPHVFQCLPGKRAMQQAFLTGQNAQYSVQDMANPDRFAQWRPAYEGRATGTTCLNASAMAVLGLVVTGNRKCRFTKRASDNICDPRRRPLTRFGVLGWVVGALLRVVVKTALRLFRSSHVQRPQRLLDDGWLDMFVAGGDFVSAAACHALARATVLGLGRAVLESFSFDATDGCTGLAGAIGGVMPALVVDALQEPAFLLLLFGRLEWYLATTAPAPAPTSLLRGWQVEDADDDLHAGIQDLLTSTANMALGAIKDDDKRPLRVMFKGDCKQLEEAAVAYEWMTVPGTVDGALRLRKWPVASAGPAMPGSSWELLRPLWSGSRAPCFRGAPVGTCCGKQAADFLDTFQEEEEEEEAVAGLPEGDSNAMAASKRTPTTLKTRCTTCVVGLDRASRPAYE